MDNSFKSDSSFSDKYKQLIRGVIVYSMLIFGLYYSEFSIYWIVLVIGLLVFLLWSTYGRQSWGDQVRFLGHSIELSKGDVIKTTIPIAVITAGFFDNRTIALAWKVEGKKSSIVIPRESFSRQTFALLTTTLSKHIAPDILENRT